MTLNVLTETKCRTIDKFQLSFLVMKPIFQCTLTVLSHFLVHAPLLENWHAEVNCNIYIYITGAPEF